MTTSTMIVGYLALFTGVGFAFLFANLLVGRFLRPKAPNVEKLEVYECGEPTIGSSFVQFDLRFYVVALLFIIFDVEVAFFFPWATVYGKAMNLVEAADRAEARQTAESFTQPAAAIYRELGVPKQSVPKLTLEDAPTVRASAQRLALFSIFDIGVFFAVLLVGFAYVWKRGDLDWVRAVSRERASPTEVTPRVWEPQHSVLSA